MKKVLFIYLAFVIHSCKSQNEDQKEIEKIKQHYKMDNKHQYNNLVQGESETFNIKRFDESKNEAEDYNYELPNGLIIREFGDQESGYYSETKIKNSLFTIAKVFHTNSHIKSKGPMFKDDCEIGIWYDFDESGKLIKELDLDKPFKIAIEDIIEYLKNNEAELFSSFTSINRSYEQETKKAKWSLIYRGKYKDNLGMYMIEIDDSTAEIIKVVKILGKEGEKEILFEK
ncbi:hypothetical protein SGQ44_17820 [Flavobacterium sp. Fl-77]|uniref:Uncharacterized protein n=1 Tax=Flavobacterium flavipigmentatum TaxID=2893884 RepID=A0AAJ2VZI3_9FLAO|nr:MULTISPECIES: hypothetical protein [unclassified Flavobacterium]MDX6183222.1 hypothetical protein [Flavobacterium sp. Fl-33]MDX6187620.1 hypothetical protein [Flavobacterium sp. Fl-77]UFH40365.1 hypothetical protein LNP22_08830 [Flavobacterium sp. F-70]